MGINPPNGLASIVPVPTYMRWTSAVMVLSNLLGYSPNAGGVAGVGGSDKAPSGAGAHSFHHDTTA